jgi:hypothetical protein
LTRAAVFLFVLAFTAVARADDLVELSIDDCAGASRAAISKLVRLELPAQDEPAPAATMRASLRCRGEVADLVVHDARGTQELSLSLHDTPLQARPRLLALSIAELVATGRLEPSAPVAPVAPAPIATVARTVRASLWLSFGVLREAKPALWSPLLALAAGYDWGSIAGLADLAFESGESRSERAAVRARVLSLSLVPMLPLLRGRVPLALGVGARAGWAWLDARPHSSDLAGRALSGPYFAPVARAALGLALSERWSLRLELELGYVVKGLRGLDADGSALLKLADWRSSASLGIGVAL